MKDLSTEKYSHEEVVHALHMGKGSRNIRFKYVLLNRDEQEIAEIDSVISGEVNMSAFNTIKRTARFRMKDFSYDRAIYMTWNDLLDMNWSDLNG